MEKFVSKKAAKLPNHVDLESFCGLNSKKAMNFRPSFCHLQNRCDGVLRVSQKLRDTNPLPPQTRTSSPTAPENVILVWSWFKIHSKIRLGMFSRGERSKLPKVVTGNLGINYRLNRNGARQWFLKPRFQGFVVGIIPMWNWTTNKIDRKNLQLQENVVVFFHFFEVEEGTLHPSIFGLGHPTSRWRSWIGSS